VRRSPGETGARGEPGIPHQAFLTQHPLSARMTRAAIWPEGAGDATARVRVRAAHVGSRQRCPGVGVAQHRSGAKELIERQSAMEDLATDQPERALEIKWAHDHLKQGRRRGEHRDATNGCSVQALHKNLR
jgi:hypothetical protein